MTEEEYLQMEEASVTRHEFRNGEIIDMAGGTFQHAEIAANLLRNIGNRLQGKPCKAIGSDLRIRNPRTRSYFYPDVNVVCGPPVYDPPDRRSTISNPKVLIEVTSASTEGFDRAEKFYDCMRIESLQEYVLVSQDRMWVNSFYKQPDGIWGIGPSARELDQSFLFKSLGIELPLSEIYAGVEMPAVAPCEVPPPTET